MMQRPEKRGIVPVALTLLILLGVGCAAEQPSRPALSEPDTERARAIYAAQACTMCHGENGEGVEDAGPALEQLEPYWDVDLLVSYLRDPVAFAEAHPEFNNRRTESFGLEMPEFGHLEQDELELLSRWLLSR